MSDISTVGCRYNGADLEFFDKASGNTVFAFRNAASSLPVYGVLNGITAHASGGQTSATPLTAAINRITVCANVGDSVLLPAALAGMEVTVINDPAGVGSPPSFNAANVFPNGTDTINALSASSAFSVTGQKTAIFTCAVNGKWHSVLSA